MTDYRMGGVGASLPFAAREEHRDEDRCTMDCGERATVTVDWSDIGVRRYDAFCAGLLVAANPRWLTVVKDDETKPAARYSNWPQP